MRKLMNKALLMAFTAVLIVFSLIATDVSIVFAAPDENRKHTERTSSTPEIEIVYETGTQNGAKERRDEEEASRNEDDGSYEVFVPEGSISGNVTVTDNETGEDSKIQWEDIHIKTPEDFSEFCKNCRVDTWSVNKNVYLDNDIILTSAEYNSVPTFGGHFYGNNYTISGYTMYEARSYTGLFCYTQKTAVIDSVVLKATVSSKGKQIVTGGLVGENHGEIRNCVFDGSVKGQNYVGGIAGYNELTGIIINCRAIGSVLGTYYTGGIAGENVGNISSCVNEAEVNTVNIDRVASVQEIDLSSYADSIISKFTGNTEEKKANTSVVDSGCVDAGGIAGLSIGVIQFCENKGQVGYEHVGYNIGGIVGRQSGYVHGCTNSGIVKGRKDVGGIVGQAEPYVVVDFTEDTITKLSENIDKLHDIIENTLSDAGDSSDTISNRLSIVKEFTDRALDQTSFLSDHTIDWTNGMVSAGNELMGRASYIMSESSKNGGPLDNSKDAFNETKDAANHLNDTVNDLDIYKYMSDSQKASYDDAKDRFNKLSKSISDNEIKYTKAAENYYIYNLLDADSKSTDREYPQSHDLKAFKFDENGNEIIDSDLSTYGKELDKWSNVSSWRHVTAEGTPLIGELDEARESDAKLVNDANSEYRKASSTPNQTDVTDKSKEKAAKEYNDKYGTSIIGTQVDSELANQALIMSGIIAAVTPAMDEAAKKDADKAADSLKDASEHLSDAGSQTKSIISDIASRGDITMPT
ncbi:MAG: GLUG motif-containing protein, partial [Lachnospiraceae bacterium]|nr:GLUG motif-containing protein [Lachnospiraceae bacterium]